MADPIDLQDTGPDRYRLALTYFGLGWAAIVKGTQRTDYTPPIRCYGFTAAQAQRRVVARADRHRRPTRTVMVDPGEQHG